MKASCRIHWTPQLVGRCRTRCPIQNSWNGDGGVGPNLIGVRSDLFEHVEIVLMAGLAHLLEDADIPTRNERHAQAEHSRKSIGTHQRRLPHVGCPPVMTHEDSTRNLQRIEQTNQVADRLQWRVQGCVRRSRAASVAAHIRSNCSISGRCDCFHLSTPRIGGIRKSVAEKNGRPVPLFSYVQGDAIGSNVVLLEGLVAARVLCFSLLTQQQGCSNGSPTREERAARNN